jgi:glycosyltransferase involved in cell wall biosynthesis
MTNDRMPAAVSVICCYNFPDAQWRWIEPQLLGSVNFRFVCCAPRNAIEKRLSALNISKVRGCLEAVRLAKANNSEVLVTHGPDLAGWCAIFAFVLSLQSLLVAHSFNFPHLPRKLKRSIFALAFRRIDRFVVFSNIEKDIYSRCFRIPKDRFEFVHWGANPPLVRHAPPVDADQYVSSIGGNARDYQTLIEAATLLPEIPFTIVVRPTNLDGLTIPPNVDIKINISVEECMAILLHSRFMILPLVNSEVPCGHVTMVAAMHLGKASIVTDSKGIADYAANGENSLTVTPGHPNSLVEAIQRLWHSPELCMKLGKDAKAFASQMCTEDRVSDHFRTLMMKIVRNQSVKQ